MVSRNQLKRARIDPQVTPRLTSIEAEMQRLYPDYRVIKKLGEGGFGAVFEIADRHQNRLAVKVQKRRMNSPSELRKEFIFYRALLSDNGLGTIPPEMPVVYDYREGSGYEFLFMERLGESLSDIMKKSPEVKLGKTDVLKVGIQVVCRLRTLHQKGILHRDVKPNNLVMGNAPDRERTVFLIDLGLSRFVQDWNEYDYDADAGFVGTRNYAPMEALYHESPSRAGDLESLLYTLLSLASGNSPWNDADPDTGRELRDSELADQRSEYQPAELCQDFPELIDFSTAVSNTKRVFEPEYERLVDLLKSALESLGSGDDNNFSWLGAATQANSQPSRRLAIQEQVFNANEHDPGPQRRAAPADFGFNVPPCLPANVGINAPLDILRQAHGFRVLPANANPNTDRRVSDHRQAIPPPSRITSNHNGVAIHASNLPSHIPPSRGEEIGTLAVKHSSNRHVEEVGSHATGEMDRAPIAPNETLFLNPSMVANLPIANHPSLGRDVRAMEIKIAKTKDVEPGELRRNSGLKAGSQESEQIQKNVTALASGTGTAKEQKGQSILDEAAHLYSADEEYGCRRRFGMEYDRSDIPAPKKCGLWGGRKRALLNKLWSKGIGRAVRLIARPVVLALTRRRGAES